jgi:hypothetical protein
VLVEYERSIKHLVQVREDGRDFGPGQARRMALAIEIDKASNPIATSPRRGRRLTYSRRRTAAAFSKPTTNTKREDSTMPTAIIFHEVQDGDVWAKAWKKGPGSRHEMFGKLGIKCRNFRDPDNPNATGVMAEIPDMGKFQELLQSEEGQKAMREDGLKVETMRMLVEFTP